MLRGDRVRYHGAEYRFKPVEFLALILPGLGRALERQNLNPVAINYVAERAPRPGTANPSAISREGFREITAEGLPLL